MIKASDAASWKFRDERERGCRLMDLDVPRTDGSRAEKVSTRRTMAAAAVPRYAAEAIFVFVAILWLGLLVGVSFIATSVKFQAPLLNLPAALDVGRVTFALFTKIEWGLYGLLIVATTVSGSCLPRRFCLVIMMIVLSIQGLWLLPVLDARVNQIMAGATVPATTHHLFYAAADLLKALLLLVLSIKALRKLAKPHSIR